MTESLPATWHDPQSGQPCLRAAWSAALGQFSKEIAWWRGDQPVTYQTLNDRALACPQPRSPTWIDGNDPDWLVRALASWLGQQPVIFYDSKRVKPKLSAAVLRRAPSGTHAIYFTSGTTGAPKPILRSTAFALREAWAYARDTQSPNQAKAIALIRPWFGALTKHCLGMLLTGTAQEFARNVADIDADSTLLYCTPSQAAAISGTRRWPAISLTGEPLSTEHTKALVKLVTPQGWVLDAFGSTECGVIARRWLTHLDLENEAGRFAGEVLPGKTVDVDAQGRLSVTMPDGQTFATGDLAKVQGKTLELFGRDSALRKIHGVWCDATPLLRILRGHPQIHHAELAPETRDQQLVVRIAVDHSISLPVLESWTLERLTDLRLFPILERFAAGTQLGPTGKRQLQGVATEVTQFRSLPAVLADVMLGNIAVAEEAPLWNCRFDHLGVDSLDLTDTAVQVERRTGSALAKTLLTTDTPRSATDLLSAATAGFCTLRQLGDASASDEILCLGQSLAFMQGKLRTEISFQLNNSLHEPVERFTLTSLAEGIIASNPSLLNPKRRRFLIGFSLDAVLALEFAHALEQRGATVTGLLLLDPPTEHRRDWLRKRTPIIGELLTGRCFTWRPSFPRELRRRAMAKQPTRTLQAPVHIVQRGRARCCWIDSNTPANYVTLGDFSHAELMANPIAQAEWLTHVMTWAQAHDLTR